MLSQTKQRLYMEAANLLGVIRVWRCMLYEGMPDELRESVSLAIVEAKVELEAIEQQIFEQYKLNKKLN